jgi:hypothetical protein
MPTDDVKTAQRAYLQRAEVRLSTMHRIASAFVSGAALLILLPLFLRDALSPIMGAVSGVFTETFVPMLYLVPLVIAFVIPIVSLFLLLKDLILFYFSASIPEPKQPEKPTFHPRFALTGIPYSDDEGEDAKRRIRSEQFKPPLTFFLLPHREHQKKWLRDLVSTPEGRRIALPSDSKYLTMCDPNHPDFDLVRMAFGLTGAYDRSLEVEVAKTELSLIRHNLLLRRLVMRYMKALILFIWTGLVLFVLVSALGSLVNPGDKGKGLFVVSLGLLIWSTFAPFLIRLPVRWIYREFDQNASDVTRDEHLVKFEIGVIIACLVATMAVTAAYYLRDLSAFVGVGVLACVFNIVVLLRSRGRLGHDAFRWI